VKDGARKEPKESMRKISVVVGIFLALCAPLLAQKSATAKTAPKKAAPAARPSTSPEKPAEEAAPPLPTQATVESFLKHTFSYDPNVTAQVLSIRPSRAAGVAEVLVSLKTPQGEQRGLFYVMPDRKFAIAGGDMMPFGADPFAPAREILSRANGFERGPENAPVTIVEFSDLECPACKAAQPTIDKLVAAEPNAKLIFQNYPLENMHPWSLLAAQYATCVGKQSKEAFWKFVSTVYQNQESVTALLPTNAKSVQEAMAQARPAISKKLADLAAQVGVNPAQVASCISEPSTDEQIKKSIDLGNELDITGTPTVFINGRRIQNVTGIPFDVLKAMVDADEKNGGK
jgi:protein-disulfide isomerase